jgi:hypothetical protein
MRNGLIGLVSGMVFASMATVACSSGGGSGGTGGSTGSAGSSGSAGSVGTGGTSSGGGAGGGAGGGSGAVTTISGSKALNALTPTEVTQLCDDTYAYFGSAIPKATTCRWRGLAYGASSSAPTDAQLQTSCANKETSCQGSADPWADNLGCNDIPSTCAATVAQYSACISDEVAAFIQLVNGFPMCSALMRSNASDILNAIAAAPPASCASLMNTCPELSPPGPLNM